MDIFVLFRSFVIYSPAARICYSSDPCLHSICDGWLILSSTSCEVLVMNESMMVMSF